MHTQEMLIKVIKLVKIPSTIAIGNIFDIFNCALMHLKWKMYKECK